MYKSVSYISNQTWTIGPDHVMKVSGRLTFEVLGKAFEIFQRNTSGRFPDVVSISGGSYDDSINSRTCLFKVEKIIRQVSLRLVETLGLSVFLYAEFPVLTGSTGPDLKESSKTYLMRLDLGHVSEPYLLTNACKRRRW